MESVKEQRERHAQYQQEIHELKQQSRRIGKFIKDYKVMHTLFLIQGMIEMGPAGP